MKRAILARFIAILMLALIISAIFSYYFIGKNMLKSNKSSMLNTVRVVDYALDYDGDVQTQLVRLHESTMDTASRITIVGFDGTVLADNEVSRPDQMENHLEREEIKSAMETGTGAATRYSESVGQNMLYVAARSVKGDYVIRMAVPYTNLLDYMILIFPVLLAGCAIALVISTVIAVRFTNTITTPLNEISEEMGKIRGESTEFSFKEYKYKELNVISRTTMKMAAEIRAHMDQLEKEKKIRQEFFSNASHELKTPITSVRGYAELLDQGFVQDEATRKDFYARILRETDNMTNLINDILMISRLETKEAEVTFSTVRMAPLLTEVFESLEPIAAEYQVMLHKECRPVSVEASAKQLRELIMNLVSNGIKYNHPGGNVWVTVWTENTCLFIRVKDDGCGISREDQSRVFERFYRVDKGRSKKMGGTGLGLSIVKHIAEYYGGSIELVSQLGKGSTFTVAIPCPDGEGEAPDGMEC